MVVSPVGRLAGSSKDWLHTAWRLTPATRPPMSMPLASTTWVMRSSTGSPLERAAWRAWRTRSAISCSVASTRLVSRCENSPPTVSASTAVMMETTTSISIRVKPA